MPHLFLFILLVLLAPCARAQISADHWNGGAVRVGPSMTACDAGATGAIRFDSGALNLKFCDGTAWRAIGAAAASGDMTPDIFSFTDLTNQPLGTMIVSNTITITGMAPDQVASVTGSGTPQISVNGGPWVASTLISPGDTITVRMVSSASSSTTLTAAIAIGTISDNWNVTTRAGQTYVFTTNAAYAGNLGGVSGADAICQAAASGAGKPGVYKAVLSTSTENVKDRLTIIHPVVRIADGVVIASTNFWTQSLESDIKTVTGNTLYGAPSWTGTTTGGVKHPDTCSDWTSDSGNGRRGAPSAGNSFTAESVAPCNSLHYVLCLQQ